MNTRIAIAGADLSTARHEGGHAVTTLVVGLTLGRVAICGPGEAVAGYSTGSMAPHGVVLKALEARREGLLKPPDYQPPITDLADYVVVLLAGGHAEALLCGKPYSLDATGAWDDRWHAEQFIGAALRKPAHSALVAELLRVVDRAALALVTRHREWIERVAAALVEKRALTGDEVHALKD